MHEFEFTPPDKYRPATLSDPVGDGLTDECPLLLCRSPGKDAARSSLPVQIPFTGWTPPRSCAMRTNSLDG
jgi:hypothetical protein